MQKAFSTATRQPAISFVAQDRTGQPLNPDSLRGKYVLLNFWASWCVVCRKDHKILNAYFNAYHKKGLEIIGIAINDKKKIGEKPLSLIVRVHGIMFLMMKIQVLLKNMMLKDYRCLFLLMTRVK
ncbi:MAG: TlpA family protein disulfide reductase [Sphingobacteriales bacterium]|nr:TlpA family protein disulfide reductase [Sphingobacteriales bacterium]